MKDWPGLKLLESESCGEGVAARYHKEGNPLWCQVWGSPNPSQCSLSSGHVTTFFFLFLCSLAFQVCSSELLIRLSPAFLKYSV